MIKISGELSKKGGVEEYLKEMEFRTTAYLRGFVSEVADQFRKQIDGRYKKSREENAQLIRENLQTVFLNVSKVPKKDKGKFRKETKEFEQHYAAVLVNAVKRSGGEINKDTTVVKFLHNKRSLKQSPAEIFILIRFGPWHIDEIPFLPSETDATTIFVNVRREESLALKKKNKSNRNKVMKLLRKNNIKAASRGSVKESLNGYDDMEYWVLRKEFGLDGRKMSVWKPALEYMSKKGRDKIMKTNIELHRTLFDPSFKGYKKIGKEYTIVPEDAAKGLIKFQDRIRG